MRFTRLFAAGLLVVLAGCASPTTPNIDVAKTLVSDAATTLENFSRHKNVKGYKDFMDDAAAVVILPDVVKAGWIFAAEAGNGVLLARQADGKWSDPSFHTLTAASVGLQIGVQDTAMVLIIRSEEALQAVLKHQGKIGADIGAAAVYAGVGAEVATTTNLGADILAFAAPVLGAYIGSSLEGSVLVVRRDLNEAVYGTGVTPQSILTGPSRNAMADALKDALAKP